ncbi:hypothetical protein MBLNU13_g06004t1 [Cladosporium sp. NU13]
MATNSDLTTLLGNLGNVDASGCPAPFIGEALHPYKGGFLGGRNCAPNPLDIGANASACCIPCPVFDYVYSDKFKRETDGAAWVHVVGLILSCILLISYAVLPVETTRRAYLNTMLLVGLVLFELGFVIPLARQPEQCYDPVTPNDQTSSLTCAFSGAFAAFGGLFLVIWVLIRALFMHLQICWDWVPGKISYIAANAAALLITIALTTATLVHSGVSFRFGGYCHVNVGSIATYWGWLLAFCGMACLLQFATFGYCIKVYLTSILHVRHDSQAESLTGSSRSRTARATARRVYQALAVQWRSLAIVTVAIVTTALVCVVFIVFDDKLTQKAFAQTDDLVPWIICLISSQDNDKCLGYTGVFILPESLAVATLFVLGFVGVEAFLLLSRVEMLKAWWKVVRRPRSEKN